MSWGATAFTPIITYNTPPFGFEERPNPSDFGTCPEDPYSGTENLKEDIRHLYNVERETLPYSQFKEFFDSSSEGNAIQSIFTIPNMILFVMVMSILIYMTQQVQ